MGKADHVTPPQATPLPLNQLCAVIWVKQRERRYAQEKKARRIVPSQSVQCILGLFSPTLQPVIICSSSYAAEATVEGGRIYPTHRMRGKIITVK